MVRWVGRALVALAGSLAARKGRCAAEGLPAQVGCEGGVGGGSTDGYWDTVSQGAGGEASSGTRGPAVGNQSQKRAGDAADSGGDFRHFRNQEAREFEDDVVVERTGGRYGSGAGGCAECGDIERKIVGADVAAGDVDVRA